MDFAVSAKELAALPVSAFGELPIETRLVAQGAVSQSVFVLSSHSLMPDRTRGTWFDRDEVEALAWAARVGRAFSSDMISFALRKLHDPSFRVTLEQALAGASASAIDGEREEPTLGELFKALELTLVGIEIGPVSEREGARRYAA